jgi:hypothetical protein
MAASDIAQREEFPREKHMSPNLEKGQWPALRRGMPKETLFKGRTSGGGKSNSKDVPEITTHRSEKALPSFLRNQTKSPEKVKLPEKKGALCKENFKIIKRLG